MSRIDVPNDRSANLWLNEGNNAVRVGVTRRGRERTDDGEFRYGYNWQVIDRTWRSGGEFALAEGGTDLHGPATGEDPGPLAMLGTFLSFLEACGSAYSYAMLHPGSEPENLDLFPEALREWCYSWQDELGMARYEIDVMLDPEAFPLGTDDPKE